jgi:hypothetical protein
MGSPAPCCLVERGEDDQTGPEILGLGQHVLVLALHFSDISVK